jgi:pyridoxamine 5'-phosphate oxidase
MAINEQLAALRAEYESTGLRRHDLTDDPLDQFAHWMQDAIDAGVYEANTMVLSTADVHGRPSARAVLLKQYDERGFVFYTNLESRKGAELASTSAEESDSYFTSRPRDSQIASASSPQSRPVDSREMLEGFIEVFDSALGDASPQRPDHWGGVRVKPTSIEFWQGRTHRLHDRFVYTRSGDVWTIERLAP